VTLIKDCRTCKTSGEVRSCVPEALPVNGVATGFSFPTHRGGMSGEIIAESGRSICGKCRGTGVLYSNEWMKGN
jgi:DnaJ-class molecular chaperone